MTLKSFLTLAAASLLAVGLTATPAAADGSQLYLGIGGSIVYGDGCELSDCSDDFDDWTWGARGTAGWQFNDWLAAEVGGHYFGEITDDDITEEDKFTAYGGSLSLVAQTQRRDSWNFFARGGVFYGRMDEDEGGGGGSDDTSVSLLVGVGANYYLANGGSIRGEIEYIPDVGNPSPAGEIDYLVFTVSYIFGL